MRGFVASIALFLFAATLPAADTLTSGDSVLLARDDGSGLVIVPSDDPVIGFVEVEGAEVVVRVTPIDRDGATVGSGRVFVVVPHEERRIRLRDEFPSELLRNAQLRVEVLEGRGRVMLRGLGALARRTFGSR